MKDIDLFGFMGNLERWQFRLAVAGWLIGSFGLARFVFGPRLLQSIVADLGPESTGAHLLTTVTSLPVSVALLALSVALVAPAFLGLAAAAKRLR